MTPRTPEGLTIRPRNLAFHRESANPRWWLGGDPIATAFYNALSATFPRGERFFIDSVRLFRDVAGPELQAQIKGFIAQESMHSREHLVFNEAIVAHGYDLSAQEAVHTALLEEAHARPPIAQLASTMAMEHLTAIIANELLSNPIHLAGAPAETRDLWRWHAMEEIEHKAVAFDTYMAAMKNASPWTRWKVRVIVMAYSTMRFAKLAGVGIWDLLRQDGIDLKRRKRDLAGFLLYRPGMLRILLGPYLRFYLPGFHPWNHDDRALIAPLQETFRAEPEAAAA